MEDSVQLVPTLWIKAQRLRNGEIELSWSVGGAPFSSIEGGVQMRFGEEEFPRTMIPEVRQAVGTFQFRIALPQDHPKHLGYPMF